MTSKVPRLAFKRKDPPTTRESAQIRPQPKYFSLDFRSDANRVQFESDIKHRSIICSRRVEFGRFISLGVRELLESVGIVGLCEIGGDTHDRLIRLFYANMTCTTKPLTVKTYILGREIKLTPSTINEIIGFPIDEPSEEYFHTSRDPNFIKQGDGLEFMKKVHRNPDIESFYKPKAKDLNVRARVIHHLISYTILPRDGHRDHVSYMDLYLMEKIYNSKRFNPGYVILSHMADVVMNAGKNLPYNTLIEKILWHFDFAIPSGEPTRKEKGADVYDHCTLARMGIVKVNEEWVFKTAHDASTSAAPSRASTIQDTPMEDAPPLAPSSHISIPKEEWHSLHASISSLASVVEKLSVRLDDIASTQAVILAKIVVIEGTMNASATPPSPDVRSAT